MNEVSDKGQSSQSISHLSSQDDKRSQQHWKSEHKHNNYGQSYPLIHKESFGRSRSFSTRTSNPNDPDNYNDNPTLDEKSHTTSTSASSWSMDRLEKNTSNNLKPKDSGESLEGSSVPHSSSLSSSSKLAVSSAEEGRFDLSAPGATSPFHQPLKNLAEDDSPITRTKNLDLPQPKEFATAEASTLSSSLPSPTTSGKNESTREPQRKSSKAPIRGSKNPSNGDSMYSQNRSVNRVNGARVGPQLPHALDVRPAPPPAMYWSRVPVHGSVPKRSFRAHTANLSEEVLWLFGGCNDRGCFQDIWCFDTGTFLMCCRLCLTASI